LLDGSDAAAVRLQRMLYWDVNNGIARRAWAGNAGARWSAERAMAEEPRLEVTLPEGSDDAIVDAALGRTS